MSQTLSVSEQDEANSVLRPVFARIAKGDTVGRAMWQLLAGLRASDVNGHGTRMQTTAPLRGAVFQGLLGNVPSLPFVTVVSPDELIRDTESVTPDVPSHFTKYHANACEAAEALGLLTPPAPPVEFVQLKDGHYVTTSPAYVMQRGDILMRFPMGIARDAFLASSSSVTNATVDVVRNTFLKGQTIGSLGTSVYGVVIPADQNAASGNAASDDRDCTGACCESESE